ncbi:CBS domain-containing protein [Bacillus lacus]|uniref:CBS domain-containing protein n=1 Tax=Metabacillus lacus TaxID=1983721 RepID=A0A7X2IZU3_9BACI|nr:acetoin utilization AcuB family protein [Metabacillus lacus]MRX72730.1 CBS domain-containing protein [Metabacillus lacus]
MIVEQIMNKEVKTLKPDHTLEQAIAMMSEKRIRHIPIVSDDDVLVGIISDRDVKEASPSIFQLHNSLDDLKKPLKKIMKTNVITGHPLDFVEEVSAIFFEHKIGCLPILKQGKIVGIVTESDLLHTFVQLTGANQPGSHIEVKVSNVSGVLAEVAGIFQKRRVNISSVLLYPAVDENDKVLVFRVQTMNTSPLISDLESAGYDVLWPNMQGKLT